jgi:low affinity Fe/Cu permease
MTAGKTGARAMDIIAGWAGSLYTSVAVFAVVGAALLAGVIARFPPWWQTAVYATNALVALVMLFVIQHTTNRQTGAILLKLDELILTSSTARDEVIDAERRDTAEQQKLHDRLHH